MLLFGLLSNSSVFAGSPVVVPETRTEDTDPIDTRTWTGTVEQSGLVILRGAVVVEDSIAVWFTYGRDSLMRESTSIRSYTLTGVLQFSDTIATIAPGETLYYRMHCASATRSGSGSILSISIPLPSAPQAVTGAISPIGTTEGGFQFGVTLNGEVSGNDLPTTYHFEYGTDESFGAMTPTLQVGPALNAFYEESFSGQPTAFRMVPNNQPSLRTESGNDFVVPTAYNTFLDHNHLSGSGLLYLSLFSYSWFAEPTVGNHSLGGAYPDLRDAVVSVRLRSNNFKPNGARLSFWAQSQLQESYSNWKRANWVYDSESLLDDSLLADNSWQERSVKLVNDASRWRYAGNNLIQNKAWRYDYWPLDSVLSTRLMDYIFALTPIDSTNPPTGSLEYDNLTIRYRNHSLLQTGNGGRLVNWPSTAVNDPALMTDGYRSGNLHSWTCPVAPEEHPEFVYRIDSLSTFNLIQVSQSELAPSLAVLCLSSNDGLTFDTLGTIALPYPGTASENALIGRLELESYHSASYLKFVLAGMYGADQAGIGEIEVFGNLAEPNPGRDAAGINVDITSLQPDQDYFYRLVAVNDSGVAYGEIKSFHSPSWYVPQILVADPIVHDLDTVTVAASFQTFGLGGYGWMEYSVDQSFDHSTDTFEIPISTLQHAEFVSRALTGLTAGETYFVRSVSVSSSGLTRSLPLSFIAPDQSPPTVTVGNGPLDLGMIAVGDHPTYPIFVRNHTDSAILITSFDYDHTLFSVSVFGSVTILPHDSVRVDVQCAPLFYGSFAKSIWFTTTAGVAEQKITVASPVPHLYSTENEIYVPSPAQQNSAATAFVQNSSINAATVDSVIWSVSELRVFGLTNAMAVTYQLPIEVQFSLMNDSVSAFEDTVRIFYNNQISPLELHVSYRDPGSAKQTNTQSTVPETFALHQNYPNPFNPSTTISFAIPTTSNVRIAIYNILGQEVTQLLDDVMNAGEHAVTWNASTASGLYFYEIIATPLDENQKLYREVRKMTLLK